jgi:arsenate reductase
MMEIGVDISGQRSKTSTEFRDIIFDLAVTFCDRAKQSCPICSTPFELPTSEDNNSPKARKVIHKSFENPAVDEGSEEEQLKVFRQVRDEIKDWIFHTFGG